MTNLSKKKNVILSPECAWFYYRLRRLVNLTPEELAQKLCMGNVFAMNMLIDELGYQLETVGKL
jgi:hypothetical protein